MTTDLVLSNLPWLAAGLGLGGIYFVLLGRTVIVLKEDTNWTRAAGFLALRLMLATGVLAFAAMQGTVPLLLTLLGFIATRMVAIRYFKGQA